MPDTHPDAAQRGYESSVFGIGRIAWFSFGLLVLVAVTAFLADAMVGGVRLPRAPVTQIPAAGQMQRPPAPVLQKEPASDLRTYRLEKASELESWGWVDRDAGIVRMPIESAMTLLAEQAARDAPSDKIDVKERKKERKR